MRIGTSYKHAGVVMSTTELDTKNAAKPDDSRDFQLLKRALTAGDIADLKAACKEHLWR